MRMTHRVSCKPKTGEELLEGRKKKIMYYRTSQNPGVRLMVLVRVPRKQF